MTAPKPTTTAAHAPPAHAPSSHAAPIAHGGRPGQHASSVWEKLLAVAALLVLSAGCVAATVYFMRPVQRDYAQATPDDLVRSAIAMVKNGDAKRLPGLIYADSEAMRASLTKLGVLLGHLQRLADTLAKTFPQQAAQLKDNMRTAATKESDSILSMFGANMGGGGGGGRGNRRSGDVEVRIGAGGAEAGAGGGADTGAGNDPGEMFRTIIAQLFTDPYGWIDANAERLSTIYVTDDTAVITLDGKPAFGIGIPMKKEEGKWYIALPTSAPGIRDVMPRVPEQWAMIDYLIVLLDKVVVETEADVRAGQLSTLKQIADVTQDKVIFPVALWAIGYGTDYDARERIDRQVRHYRDRQKKWVISYAESKGASEKELKTVFSPKLGKALEQIARKEIEVLERARKWKRPTDFTDAQFVELITPWVKKHGLLVDVSGASPMVGAEVEALVEAWEAKQENAKKPPLPNKNAKK